MKGRLFGLAAIAGALMHAESGRSLYTPTERKVLGLSPGQILAEYESIKQKTSARSRREREIITGEAERILAAMKPKQKGELNGLCNREACQKPGAVYYNHSTQKHYCPACAKLINDMNRKDAMEMFGHELCTLVIEK